MKECLECGQEFYPKTHNQKYHNPECCRIATNRKVMENYYAKKKRLKGEKRNCIECGAALSRYNDGDVCEICSHRDAEDEYNKVIGGIILNASRGIKKSKSK